MGLAVEVGVLAYLEAHDLEGAEWFKEQLRIVNELLSQHKLPPHAEPKSPVPDAFRFSVAGFPYSFMQHLRRAAAHRSFDSKYVAQPVDVLTRGDEAAIEQASVNFDFHLLVHSDAEGFYVPVEFRDVIFDKDHRGLAGGMLGSTVRLMQELREVAPALGIRLDASGELSDTEPARLEAAVMDWGPLHKELLAWLNLFEAARLSLKYKTMIVFQ